jgi:uncharacterized protein YbjT (DUF2867 family)
MFGYFASKRAAERVVEDSGLPWTTLRATQFHDLLLMVTQQMARSPVIPAPAGFRFQPVDTGEVATRLTELTLSKRAGLVPDMGGPRAYLRATHRQRLIVPLPLPGKAAGAFRAGANQVPGKAPGLRTWEEFLADRVS